VELTHPWFLTLGAGALLWLWLAQRRSLADLTLTQRRVCFAIRAVILLLLVLALSGVRLLMPSREVAVVFAIDGSASISPEARQQARAFVEASLAHQQSGDVAAVVGFAGEPLLWQPPVESARLAAETPEPPGRTRTDIGRALEFSSAIFPAEMVKRLVVLTDGNDTADRAAEVAQRIAGSGVEISAVPLRNQTAAEVLVERVEIPHRLRAGEPFDLVANLRSSVATTAKVRLYHRQFLLSEEERPLQIGDNEFRAPNLQTDESFASYEVEVIPADDTVLENNRAQATATQQGQPRVLIVDSEEAKARPLAEALRGEKIAVEVRGALGVPRSLEDLQQFDLLMLSDISALTLSREQMELYRRWVQDFGGGFVMIGGENSFGVGGYYRTAIEQMLPVRMEHDDRQDTPSVALLWCSIVPARWPRRCRGRQRCLSQTRAQRSR
jgi:hypothetical protein